MVEAKKTESEDQPKMARQSEKARVAKAATSEGDDENGSTSRRDDTLLRAGTYISAVLAFACIAGAMILCTLVLSYADSAKPDILILRLLMSCIACFIAMGFGCLGFGLFLIRARGAFRAESEGSGAVPKGTLESNAPGLIVIVCATVIMWLALRVRLSEETTTTTPQRRSSAGAATQDAPGGSDATEPRDPLVPPERDPVKEGVTMP